MTSMSPGPIITSPNVRVPHESQGSPVETEAAAHATLHAADAVGIDTGAPRVRADVAIDATLPSEEIRHKESGESDEVFDKRRMDWLCERYNAEGLTPELIGDMYYVARDMAVSELVSTAMPHRRKRLQAYVDSIADHKKRFSIDPANSDTAGGYTSPKSRLGITASMFSDTSKLAANIKAKLPGRFRNQGEANLGDDYAAFLAVFRVVAHETGHAFLHDISLKFCVVDGEYNLDGNRLLASALYMKSRPEHGITGNYITDYYCREEQFAEGFGQMVIARSARLLGYNSWDAAEIVRAVKVDTRFDGLARTGQEQIDVLDQVNGNNGSHKLLQGVTEREKLYAGKLGYGLPLTKGQLRAQLLELAIVQDTNSVSLAIDTGVWAASSRAQRTWRIARYVRRLERARADGIIAGMAPNVRRTYESRRTRLLAISMLAGSLALAGGMILGERIIGNDSTGNPADEVRSQNTVRQIAELVGREDIYLGRDGIIYDSKTGKVLTAITPTNTAPASVSTAPKPQTTPKP